MRAVRPRPVAAVAAALLAAGLAGCGGGDPVAAAPAPASTTPAATTSGPAPAADPTGLRPAPLRPPAQLGDEFSTVSTPTGWRLSQGDVLDGAAPTARVAGGMLTVVSARSAWIGSSHGFGLARRTTGDFAATLRVRPSGVRDPVPTVDWSLTGLMLRAPTTNPDTENWVHLSAGYVGRPVVERKDTLDSRSELVVSGVAPGWIELRVVRSGAAVVLLRRSPGAGWAHVYTYLRPDLPPTVELLLTAQSGYESDHADLVSTVDRLRVRPVRLSASARATLREGDRPPPAAVLAALTA